MDASAAYADALRRLSAPLPAYVTYVARTFGAAGSLEKDEKDTVVVRTRDGAIVKGKNVHLHFSSSDDGGGHEVDVNPVSHPPFKPRCYTARSASASSWNERPADAIALNDVCPSASDESDIDFQTLYVDPLTHEPIAAVGVHGESHVTVTVVEHFERVGGHVLPADVKVHVQGHGIVGFLDLEAGQVYSDYAFSDVQP